MKQNASAPGMVLSSAAVVLGVLVGLPGAPAVAADIKAPPVLVPQSATTTQYDMKRGFPDHNGPFSAMIVIIPKAEMAEFDKPSGGSRHLDRVARAEPGAELAVKVLFTGIKGDWNGNGNVTFDLQIVGPDGKVYGGGDYHNIDALHGPVGTGEGVFDNRAKVVQLAFEGKDLPGGYTVKAVVHDRVAQLDVPLQTTIELLPARVAGAQALPDATTAVDVADGDDEAAPAKGKKKSRHHRRRHR